ncbi:MAG: hypothetical protein ABWY13_06165 [Mesorhizobium sp.]
MNRRTGGADRQLNYDPIAEVDKLVLLISHPWDPHIVVLSSKRAPFDVGPRPEARASPGAGLFAEKCGVTASVAHQLSALALQLNNWQL